jgi:arabinofuranosyltransferase
VKRYGPWVMLALGFMVIEAVVLNIAWVHEDAFITFRVVDNALQGYGLRWNVDERVQAFTHPLWLLLLIAAQAFVTDIRYGSIVVSVLSVAGYYAAAAALFRKHPWVMVFAFILPVLGSRAFLDYASSGLENPLSYALYGGFLVAYMHTLTRHETPWFWLALMAALSMLNRLDSALLYAPAFLFLMVTQWRSIRWLELVAGGLPLVMWHLFSLFYYGFLLPNTYYSKLSNVYPLSAYLSQGLLYAADIFTFSPLTTLILLAGMVYTLIGCILSKDHKRVRPFVALGLGPFLYCFYVVRIGGDYMSGRMWSLPFSAYVLILPLAISHLAKRPGLISRAYGGVLLVLLVLQPWIARPNLFVPDIADERRLRLINCFFCPEQIPLDAEGWGKDGLIHRKQAEHANPFAPVRHVVPYGSVGKFGYLAGPKVTIVDTNGLTDAFIARRPPAERFRIGHFTRVVTPEYLHARATDDLSQMDPWIQVYYKELRRIISGPLLDPERLKSLVFFNLGMFDSFRTESIRHNPKQYFNDFYYHADGHINRDPSRI